MAAFAIFSTGDECTTTGSYRVFVERLQRETKSQLGDKPIFGAANFKYYATYKDTKKQHVFKDFIYHMRMKMYDGTSILICENIEPTLKYFVHLIEQLKTPDETLSSTAYYGEIKTIITGFMNYYTSVIDETEKKLDKYVYLIDSVRNKLLLELIDETIAINEENQSSFLEEYLPLNTEVEKERYQLVIDAHANCLKELKEITAAWETRQNKLENFMKDTFEASVKKIVKLCKFVHSYVSMMLGDRLFEITESITVSATRMNCNLRKCKELFAAESDEMIQALYEKNKEYMGIYRRTYKKCNDTAEISKTIQLIKDKIASLDHDETLARLELETRFWNKRLKDFDEIASVLVRIRYELDNLNKELEEYNKIKDAELPGTKTLCFTLMGENIDEKILYYTDKQSEMSKALITFFTCKGQDRTLFTSRDGYTFFIDEYNHQNYRRSYGMGSCHVNCQGEYLTHSENKPYYFDENGRYTLNKKGEKIYQMAPCTSQFKLDEDELLTKITKDCGHTERYNPDCRLAEIKDKMPDRVILPKVDAIDMTGTLDTESVAYLWDNYGMILAEVLSAVATEQPRNPIHFMAHLLLKRKFEASAAELRNYKKMGEKYRKNVQKERFDKAIAERRSWEAKLIKRDPLDNYDATVPDSDAQQMMDCLTAQSLGYY